MAHMEKAKSEKLEKLLWEEVASKAIKSSFGFIIIAIVSFFFYQQLRLTGTFIRALTLIVIVSNIFRMKISKEILKGAAVEKLITPLKLAIYLNSLCWGIIFFTASYESKSDGLVFMVTMTIFMFFIAASLVTLAYNKSIFFFHHIVIITPMLALFLYQDFSGINSKTSIFVILYFMVIFYQSRQYTTYRGEIEQRLSNQIDLTESYEALKESQRLLVEQTEKLIESSKISALGEMAGGLAHEINNSAMVILGSAQQVDRELKNQNSISPKNEKRIQNIVEAVLKMKTVIDGLKYFAREMEGEDLVPTPLKEIIERTLHYSQEMLKAHGVNLIVEKIPPVEINCRPFQITHVLFNLLRNADDALKSIPLPERWIKIKFNISEGIIQINVINSGKKIPKEVQAKLFQPFFTTKEINLGSGLSLCSSKGVALDHGGNLYFNDHFPHTCFSLELKLHFEEREK